MKMTKKFAGTRRAKMKRKTYNNMVKAVKILENKGYSREESNDIAIRIFDEHEKGIFPIEHWLDMVVEKEV